MALDFGQAGESLASYRGIQVNKHSTVDVKLRYFDFQITCSGIATFLNLHHTQKVDFANTPHHFLTGSKRWRL